MPFFIGTYDESDIGRKTSTGNISCTRLIRRPVELKPTTTVRHPIHPNSPYPNDQGRQTPVLIGSYANTPTENKTVYGEFSSPRPRRKQTPSECNESHPDSDKSEQRRQTPLTIGSYEKPSFGLSTVYGEFSSDKFASRPQCVHTTSECNSPHPYSDKSGQGRHTPVVIGSVSTPEAEHKPITGKFSSDQFASWPTKLVHRTSECSSIRPNFDQGRQSPVVIGSVSTPEAEHKPITAKFSSDQFASRRRVRTTSECSSLLPNFDQGRQSPVVIGSVSTPETEHKPITAKFSSDQFASRRRVRTTSECSSIRPILDANGQGRHTPVLIGSVSTPESEHKPLTAKFSSDQFGSRPMTLFHTTSECSSLRPNIDKNDQESETILHDANSTRPLVRTPLFESEAEWFAESGEPQETKPSSIKDTQHEPEKETQHPKISETPAQTIQLAPSVDLASAPPISEDSLTPAKPSPAEAKKESCKVGPEQTVSETVERTQATSLNAEPSASVSLTVSRETPPKDVKVESILTNSQITETPSQPLQAVPSGNWMVTSPALDDELTPAQETHLASETVADHPSANKGDTKQAEDDVIIATEETQSASQAIAGKGEAFMVDSKEAEDDVVITTEHPQISETPSQPFQAAPSAESTAVTLASMESLTPAKETQLASQAAAEQPPANKGDSKDAEDDFIIATEETHLASQPVTGHPAENEGDSKEAEEDVISASEHPQISETPSQPSQAAPSEDSMETAPASNDSLTPAKETQSALQAVAEQRGEDKCDSKESEDSVVITTEETQLAPQAVGEHPPANKGDSKVTEDDVIIATEETHLASQPVAGHPAENESDSKEAEEDVTIASEEIQSELQVVPEHPPANKDDSKQVEDDDIVFTEKTHLASQPVAGHPAENEGDSKEAEEDVTIASEPPQISETPSQPSQAAPSEDSMDTAPASNDSLTSAKETQSALQAVADQRGEGKCDSNESEDNVVVATEETQLAPQAVGEHPPANKGDSKDTEDDFIIATEETHLASQPVAGHPAENEGDSKEAEEDVTIASEHPQISETPSQPSQAAHSEDSMDTAPASNDSLTSAKETQSASQVVTEQRPEDKGDLKHAEDPAIIVTEPPRVYEPVTVTHKLWPVVTSTEPPLVREAKTSVQPAGKKAEESSITKAQLPRTDAVPSEERTDLRKSDDEGSVQTEPSPPEANEESCKVGPEQTVSEPIGSTQATSLTAEPPAPVSKSFSRETPPSNVQVDSVVTRASNTVPLQQTSAIEEIRKWKHEFQNIKNATCVLQRLLSSNANKDTASRNADEIAKIHDLAKSMLQMQSQLEANVQHYRKYVEQKKAANEKPAFTVENMLRELADALDDLQLVQKEYLEFRQKEDPAAQPSEKSGSPFKLRHDRV